MRAFGSPVSNPVERAGDRLGAGGIIGQVLKPNNGDQSVVVPTGAPFAFAEVLAPGNSSSSTAGGVGGAGNDAIIAVTPGETLVLSSARDSVSTVKRGSTVLITASTGTTGKYPGSVGVAGGSGGVGGGRLAAKILSNNFEAPGPGGGAYTGADGVQRSKAGVGAQCLTFFGSYDEALAFAKAVYGGSWTP